MLQSQTYKLTSRNGKTCSGSEFTFLTKQLENGNIFLSVETGSHISLPYWISYLFDYFIIVWMKLKDPWTKHDHKVNNGCKAFMLKMAQTTSTLFRTCAKVMHFVCDCCTYFTIHQLSTINQYQSVPFFWTFFWSVIDIVKEMSNNVPHENLLHDYPSWSRMINVYNSSADVSASEEIPRKSLLIFQ